jgi:phage shock protein A
MSDKKKSNTVDVRGMCASILVEQNRLERKINTLEARLVKASNLLSHALAGGMSEKDVRAFLGEKAGDE